MASKNEFFMFEKKRLFPVNINFDYMLFEKDLALESISLSDKIPSQTLILSHLHSLGLKETETEFNIQFYSTKKNISSLTESTFY